ncbi:MAG: response regulator, partial [Planctomycetota bacterium]|nr:response regulator [Planctomycetota bacterium]
MTKPTVLIVEDEPALVEVLSYNLINEGFEVFTSTDGQDGLRRARDLVPDLVILDLMLPVMDGLQVCRQIRADAKTAAIRVLILTARGEEVDEIVGFNMGADDYVTKPFKIKPLIHRIKALLRRRSDAESSHDTISTHGIVMNRSKHVATCDDREMVLTLTEFRLLWTLTRNPGWAYSRLDLMDLSLGEDANSMERTIDVHVRALRQKLGDKADLIETVRGVGYRFRT